MSRTSITTSDLKKMSNEHISYEIQMFRATITRMTNGGLSLDEHNALLESFLIHARCLLDFLYQTEKPRPDDVIADDFFEDPSIFHKLLPHSIPAAEYLKQRTGKEVAHLTYGRLKVSATEKVWNIGQIHDQLAEALAIFFECLTADQRKWFTTIITR